MAAVTFHTPEGTGEIILSFLLLLFFLVPKARYYFYYFKISSLVLSILNEGCNLYSAIW